MLTLLLIEDCDLIRDRMLLMLEQIPGVEVIACASRLSQADAVLRSLTPDLLVLDLQLPDGNALQAIGGWRALAPQIQMVVFTNQFGAAVRAQCAQVGLEWVFDKSCEIDLLLDLVQRLSCAHQDRASA